MGVVFDEIGEKRRSRRCRDRDRGEERKRQWSANRIPATTTNDDTRNIKSMGPAGQIIVLTRHLSKGAMVSVFCKSVN